MLEGVQRNDEPGDLQHLHPSVSKRAEQELPTSAFTALDLLPLLGASRSPGADLRLAFGFSSSRVGSGLRLEEDHIPPLRSWHLIGCVTLNLKKQHTCCALLGLSKVIFGVLLRHLFCPIGEIPGAIILCYVVAAEPCSSPLPGAHSSDSCALAALRTTTSPLLMARLSQSSFAALPEVVSTKISPSSPAHRAAIRLGLRCRAEHLRTLGSLVPEPHRLVSQLASCFLTILPFLRLFAEDQLCRS